MALKQSTKKQGKSPYQKQGKRPYQYSELLRNWTAAIKCGNKSESDKIARKHTETFLR